MADSHHDSEPQALPTNGVNRSQSPTLPEEQPSLTKPSEAQGIGPSPICKATGPRTARGKKRSRRNSLKHGLFSKFVLIEGESFAEYAELLRGLQDDFSPQGKLENILIEILATLLWRLRRFYQAERAEITEGLACMVVDYPARQHAESLERSGAASGGLLSHLTDSYLVRHAIRMFGLVRESLACKRLTTEFGLVKFLYGEDPNQWTQRNFRVLYERWARVAERIEKHCDTLNDTDPKSSMLSDADLMSLQENEAELRASMIEIIDSQIDLLTDFEKKLLPYELQRMPDKLSTALIPGPETSDHLLRYETQLNRHIDRVITQFERVCRIRMGQPPPPQIDIKLA